MVRVYLYEATAEGYKIPLFKSVLVGWTEFLRLVQGNVITKIGKTYGMVDVNL